MNILSVLAFIKDYWGLFAFIGAIIIGLIYVHNKHKKAKYRYTESFVRILNNKDHEFYRPIRSRDLERIKNLPPKKNIIGRDIDDTTSFAITLAAGEFKNRIIGIDCRSFTVSPFEFIVNEIMYIFKKNQFMSVIVNTLMFQITKNEKFQAKSEKETIEQLGAICKKEKYVVVLFNLDKETVAEKYYNDALFKYFMETIPNLIITSNTTGVTGDKVMEKFWLTGLDYLSFCSIINYKLFKGENEIKTEVPYLDEKISNNSSRKYDCASSLAESNKKFYVHTYSLIGNESGKFEIIKAQLDINEQDKSISLIERKFLQDKITGNFGILMHELSGEKKALLYLLYNTNNDYSISLYDKDLDRMFNGLGYDYFAIKNELLNLGMIEEMRPENYCNFLLETEFLYRKDPNLYCEYLTRGGTVDDESYLLTFKDLLFNIDKLFELACHQRSFKHSGIYLSPLFNVYLKQQKYSFAGIEDLSAPFLRALESTVSDDMTIDRRKRMVLHKFRTILTEKPQPVIDSFAGSYINSLGNIYDEFINIEYYSYLLNQKFPLRINYASIISNEATVFFRGNFLHERIVNADTNSQSIIKMEVL